ncbi:MAG: RNA polymerase-binding protein DksA [Rhodoferax sp.]|nr:RNA polymerase-binding protein DksA [Rhodoferax sp.]
MKATAKKNKTNAKASVKPASKAVKAKVTARKPAPAKAVVKKVAVKKPVKAPLKTVTKALAKPAAKPVAKAKPVVKAKAVVKAKPVVKTKVALKTKPAAKAKPALKAKISSVKAAPKAAAKAASKPSRPAAAPKSPVKSAVGKSGPASAKAKTMPPAPVPPTPTAKANMLTPPPALKPGRRSSARATAHMPPPAPMVPTHAPDAAKASYSTITERVISPPPHVAAKKDPKLANNWKNKDATALSDEEVKAMPDSEYMNDKQLAFFRHKLSLLKQEIHASAGETTEHLREDTVVVPDPADRATIEEEHALELRTRDRERKLLKKIEQSISRIDAGDYGYCDETGEAIGVGRLIARPTASLSLEAQQRRELKQKMFGD